LTIRRVNFFNFSLAARIFQKSTKWSIMHWEGVFIPKKNRGGRLAISRVNFCSSHNFSDPIHLPSALLVIWLILKKFVRRTKNWLGIWPIAHLDYFYGLNTPSQCIFDHLVDFEKFVPRAKNWKNWLGISPTGNLNYFFGINTPSQCIIDHLVNFRKIRAVSEKLKKFTLHIVNRPPRLFFWPKYTFLVHYWLLGWFWKICTVSEKLKKLTRHIANRQPQLFFWPKYTFPVHYWSFGWYLKN